MPGPSTDASDVESDDINDGIAEVIPFVQKLRYGLIITGVLSVFIGFWGQFFFQLTPLYALFLFLGTAELALWFLLYLYDSSPTAT